ncbi:hypothetical protein RAN3_2635 [plant metagenome]|uniref:Uncharacterized protein n=1 Tax=plant metagenome TaxID=1297885 RepID=A0A484VCD3_9ZZZZ
MSRHATGCRGRRRLGVAKRDRGAFLRAVILVGPLCIRRARRDGTVLAWVWVSP